MGEVNVSLVKYDDFTRLDPRAHLPRPLGIVVPGGVDNGKARQKTLQVQTQMAFGGGFPPPMLGPIHARGNQLDGGRVHQMNRPLEPPDKSFPRFATDEARREIAQVFEHRPEELLRHRRRADFVGVGQIVAAGRSGSPQAGQRTRMQAQGITHVIEPDAVSQLRIQ